MGARRAGKYANNKAQSVYNWYNFECIILFWAGKEMRNCIVIIIIFFKRSSLCGQNAFNSEIL